MMRPALICVLLALAPACLAGPLTAPPATKNLVANGGFETYGYPEVPRWGCDRKTWWPIQTEERHGGQYALAVTGNPAFANMHAQPVDLEVGQTYTLSAWMKADGLTTLGPGEDTVGIKVIDAGWYWSVSLQPEAPTAGWKHYAVTFKAPPSQHYPNQYFSLTIYMPRRETGRLWVDDIQLERGPTATAFTSQAIADLHTAVRQLNQAESWLADMPGALARLQPAGPGVKQLAAQVNRLRQDVARAGVGIRAFGRQSDAEWEGVLATSRRVPLQVGQLAWLAWWANPWDRPGRRQAPDTATLPAPARLRLAVNDYAPLALNVTNLTGQTLDVRARLVTPPAVPGTHPGVLHSPPWATLRQARIVAPADEGGVEYPTMLPRLDESQTMSVGAAETGQVWVDVDTTGMAPGRHEAQLELTPMVDLPSRVIPLVIEVAPVVLPVKCPAEVFCWGLNPLEELGISPDMSQEEINRVQDPWLADLARHGINRILQHSQSFTPQFAADDGLAEPIDFTWHDKLLASKRRYMDNFVGGYSVAEYHMPLVADEQFQRRFGAMMTAWIAHLRALGLTPDQFPFELVDEPGGDKQVVFDAAYRVLKEIAPEWKAMAAISQDAPATLASFAKTMEIMVVGTKLSPEADRTVQESGREVWTYRCSGSLSRLDPYAYYRLLPWVTWAKGYSGFGFYWTMSGMDSPRDNVYSQYYFGNEGPVPSRAWQAFWRGTRDWAYLDALRSVIAAARREGDTAAADRGEATLTQAVSAVATTPGDARQADVWRQRVLEELVRLQQ